MGFYGKVEHTDKLNFVIDKIYPNRKTMDEEVNNDGVFIGRYVLIEYEQAINNSPYLRLYKKPDTMDFYFDVNFTAKTRAKYIENKDESTGDYYIEQDEIIYILDDENIQQFYKCTGKSQYGNYAVFTALAFSPDDTNNYHNNYRIDIDKYGESRGFDSTVWQKIYVDEKEKYVMIAELNSVVPTFDITVDAPTLNPVPPHFDNDSNNVYYKLHMQPSWGFKVKEAKGDTPSDTDITATIAEWNDTNKTLTKRHKNYKGAIYFNRDGFNPDYHYIKNDEEILPEDNYIQVSTEASGRKYNSSHGTNNNHDIQALEIMLPGIGKALSELWDLAYGKGEVIDEDKNKKVRNKEVNWDTTTGLRLVKTSRNPENSGFEYDIQSIDTIAGCINSVHDLMGMIIVNDKDQQLEIDDALINRIYYRDGQYWIKDLTYEYVDVSNENQKIDNMKQFGDNYYYKNGNNYYKELEGYQAGNQYYEFGKDVVNEVKLCQEVWKPKTYYYKDGENFKLDDSQYPDETKKYFKITQSVEEVKNVVNNEKTGLCFFPTQYNSNTYNTLFPTVKATSTSVGKGLFYLGKDANGKTGYLPYEQGKVSFQTPLHYWDGYKIEISTTTDGKFIETYEFSEATETLVQMIEFKENTFYHQDETTKEWVLLRSQSEIDLNKIYYQFGESGIEKIEIDGLFYEPNLYYYLDYVDYIMDTDEEREPNITYYTINENAIQEVGKNTVFYEPNKYFYFNGNEYVIDSNETMTDGREYYRDVFTRYVSPDSSNKSLLPGSIWNEEIKNIPDGIKLANRKEVYKWKQLNGFARTLNTINGLILKINNVLKINDKLTRDTNTVQGCINKINDIINTIDKLKPNHFIVVDEYGKMTSMAQETDNWIDIKINENNNDKVIITHEFHPISDTTSNSDVNENGDSINLYTPKVDNKGHIIGKNTETIKLPFGYKTFQDSETTPGKTVAGNTQDTLILNGDSWIKPTITQGKIQYSHIGPVMSNENKKLDLTPAFGDSFEIEDWYFDDKGHKSNKTIHTVKIPQGSLIDINHNNADIITQLKFIPATGEISTDRKNISKLILTDYVKNNDNSSIVATDSLGEALSKLQTQIIEEQNARVLAINDLDVASITTETDEVFDSISEVDGKINATKKRIGNLTLNGWTLGDTNDISHIADTDTINVAFGKVQRQLNSQKNLIDILNSNATTPGSVAYQVAQVVNENNNGNIDTLNEIAAWIISDTSGAAKMNTDILTNAENIDKNVEAIEALEELVKDNYALASDLISVTERVQNLENSIPEEKILKWDEAVEKLNNYVPLDTYNALVELVNSLEERLSAVENILDSSGEENL